MQITAVGDVAGRIAEIRSRWAAGASSPTGSLGAAAAADTATAGEGTAVLGDAPAFDPFGAVYQAALARQAAATSLAGTRNGLEGWNVAGTASATGASGATGTGTIGRYGNRIGGYGPMPVPSALAAYGNGRVPREALTPIGQGSHRLWGPAADSFVAMRDAAARDGVQLTITDSYRTYDQQVELAQRKGLTSNGGYAAVPGTSNHGWGLAVDADVTDARTYAWLAQHGAEHGWVQILTKEPWHWEYRPAQAMATLSGATTSA